MKRKIERSLEWFYFPFVKKLIPYQTFLYLACGSANTAFDLTLYAVLYNFVFGRQNLGLGWLTVSPYIAAFLIVFPITLLTGYWLMNNIVFMGSPSSRRTKLTRYFIVVCVNLTINYVGLKVCIEQLGFYPTPSKLLITVVCVLVSYLSQRYFTFRHYTPKDSPRG